MPKFESKNFAEASEAEIRDFATQMLGIPVEDKDKPAEVLAKVRAAHEGETIFVPVVEEGSSQEGSPPPDVEASDTALVGTLGHKDPKVTLTLHAEDRDGVVNTRHKEVGVNGQVWLLKRGESISIPMRVFEALENAERHVITHSPDGETREQRVKNTPFNIEKMPSKEAIAEWHARTDASFAP